MIALSNSIHLYARPDSKEQLLEFFTSMLGLQAVASADAVGSPELIYSFKFSNGAGLSVEFTEAALSDQQAQRGAWLELGQDDALGLQQKARAAGRPRASHPALPCFYIQPPAA